MTTALSPPLAREWVLCPGCRSLHYAKVLTRSLRVCPECGRHERIGARERLEQLADPGSLRILDLPVADADPLGFVDRKPYPQRRAEARAATGLDEAIVCARLEVHGRPVVAAVMDFAFLGGSLGHAVGQLLSRAAGIAVADRVPLLMVTASGGARMQEGAIALMQMARTAIAVRSVQDAGLLTISLITDPTYGGVAASFATLAQVIVAEPGARLGFAGPRVVARTIGQRLPEGFQSAEFLLERGFIDLICPRGELRERLGRLLRATNRPAVAPTGSGVDELITDPAEVPDADPWRTVQAARAMDRPNIDDYLRLVVEDFEELRGDRLGDDCAAIVGGLGRWAGVPVMVIGNRKGHTTAEVVRCNYGMASPAGYRKAARLMRVAEQLDIPVVTLIDTPGAYPGPDAEENGQAFAIAENIALMAGLRVPVVAVITGEGGSGGALALAVADRVLMLSDAVYSVISPEGCAAILWSAGAAATAVAAAALRLDARSLLTLGVVDGVVPVPAGGAGAAPAEIARRLRDVVAQQLTDVRAMDPDVLLARRRVRFDAAPVHAGAASRWQEGDNS